MSSWCISPPGGYAGFREYVKPELRTEFCRPLVVAVVDPNLDSQRATLNTLKGLNFGNARCFNCYPANHGHAESLKSQGFDVILISLDDPKRAFETIEALSSNSSNSLAVMAYGSGSDHDLQIRAARSGAREFLPYPLSADVVRDALRRASDGLHLAGAAKEEGKLHIFCGAKGGSGVTTIATNFAVALAQETQDKTLLIDLDVPLGDAALSLGINSRYSTLDALRKAEEVDSVYLSGLLTNHACGLSVLGAPGVHTRVELRRGAADRLMTVAKLHFANVVIDAGSHWSWDDGSLFTMATKIYFVTQVGIAELRNSNRVLTSCLMSFDAKLEVIINRFTAKGYGLDEDAIETALTRPAQWRIPSDYPTVRRMQNAATPLVTGNSTLAKSIRSIARSAAGLEEPSSKKLFAMFG